MNSYFCSVIGSAGILFLTCSAPGVEAVLLNDAYTSQAASQRNINYGASPNLLIDGKSGAEKFSWLKFDILSVLPSGTTFNQVTKATLKLYANKVTNPGTVNLWAIDSTPWTEPGIKSANAPGYLSN